MVLELIEDKNMHVVFADEDGNIPVEAQVWIKYELEANMDEFIDGKEWLDSTMSNLPYADKLKDEKIFCYNILGDTIYIAVGLNFKEEKNEENSECKGVSR